MRVSLPFNRSYRSELDLTQNMSSAELPGISFMTLPLFLKMVQELMVRVAPSTQYNLYYVNGLLSDVSC